jgi:hypothetical protein
MGGPSLGNGRTGVRWWRSHVDASRAAEMCGGMMRLLGRGHALGDGALLGFARTGG